MSWDGAIEQRWEAAQENAAHGADYEQNEEYLKLLAGTSELDDVCLTEAITEQPSTMELFKKFLSACKGKDLVNIVMLAKRIEGNIEAYVMERSPEGVF